MFKKLLIIVALVAVGAGTYGIAQAFFSKDAPVSAAAFKAGTIDINLEQHAGYNTVPFSMENWMPGQTQDVVVDVRNNSTVPVTLTGHIDGTWENGMGDQYVKVIAADYWDGGWKTLAADSHGTFTYADFDTPTTLKQVPANGGVVTLRMTAKFDENAGNEYQGKTYSAGIFVTASQVVTTP